MSLVFKIMKAAASFHGVEYNEKKQKQGTCRHQPVYCSMCSVNTIQKMFCCGRHTRKYLISKWKK